MEDNPTPRRGRVVDALNLALGSSSSETDDIQSSAAWSQDDAVLEAEERNRQAISATHLASPSHERPGQRRAASANQVSALAQNEPPPTHATFESPLRSILVSSPATASVSVNTALASLSASTATRSGSGPFAGLASASTRRAVIRSNDPMPSPPSDSRPPVLTLEKDLDDMEAGSSTTAQYDHTLNTTLSRLFVTSDCTTPAAPSRLPSHLRTLSGIGRSLNDTSTLTGHLFHHGFMEGRHSDITIIVFGERYRLHKLLLDRVPFFASAFSGPWAESSAKEMALHPEEIDSNISKASFELAIKRIYGMQFPIEEEQEAVSLFAAASWLNLPDLVESCVDSILRQMQPSTLHQLIRLVTTNYYGKPGERILASAKAMLCREGWEMEYSSWDQIPSDLIREVIGGDPFFVPTEWERWFVATKILNRKLKAKAIEAGLISPDGMFLYSKPASLRFFAVRFDSIYRRQSGYASSRNVHDKDALWVALYTSPEISPLLVLLDEGIHYMHLRFEQLQQLRTHRDLFGVPTLPEKVISDALWMSMELRQRVLNAHENDLELGLARTAATEDLEEQAVQCAEPKGKQRKKDTEPEIEEAAIDSESWDGNARPRKFWIPSDDISCVMGGTREAHAAAAASSTDWNQAASRLSASLEPTDMIWASDFVPDSGRPLSQSLSNSVAPRYSSFPPFRFSAEFPNPRSLKDKKRIYSRTFWYAGSLWNVYIQRMHNSKNQQLGIYLHRAKEIWASGDLLAEPVPASVDDRIGQLEREMLLRKTERRRRAWPGVDAHTSPMSPMLENSQGLDQTRKEAKSPDFWADSLRSSTPSGPRLPDLDEEDEDLLRANQWNSVPTMQNYLDPRPMIKTYFKIYSPDRAGRLLSIYESAPEKFVVSKSWGWKSSQTIEDDGSLGYDLTRTAKDSKLRYMVVIGNSNGQAPPKLFQPLTIRGTTFQNRIFLSPLCQYSSENGYHTAWQLTHLGGIIQRGPGLSLVEATSVTAQGRITPEDSGLWEDGQKEPLRKIVEFAHSQNQKIGIQLGHAGRKASTVAPWLSSGDTALEEANGWPKDVWAPSAIAYNDRHPLPNAYTLEGIEELKTAFGDAIKRAVDVGFDVIELHFAHGYLLHEFFSPVTNKRTDKYGGSFENRTRLGVELVDLARSIIPRDMPLFARVSATDWLEEVPDVSESWTQQDTAKLAAIFADHGLDLLDVSTGGLDPRAKMKGGPAYQAPFAKYIKKHVGDKLLVTTVGSIDSGTLAQQQLDDGLDAVFSGRWFQKNPGLVWQFAEDLGVEINVANQIRWAFRGRGVVQKGQVAAR